MQSLQFSAQYFSMYRHRLEELRTRIHPSDCSSLYTEKITDVKPEQHVFLIGIIVRSHHSRASNIEKYIVKVGTMEPRPSLGNFSSPSDTVFLEDENGRIAVDTSRLELEWTSLVTGVVVGIRGRIKEDAVLEAHDIHYPSALMPPQVLGRAAREEYICFISGMEVGHPYLPHSLLHVFIDFLLGAMEENESGVASKIVRLVILGDSIFKPLDARTVDRKAVGDNDVKGFREMSSSLRQLDTLVAELSGIFPVDIIPGELDPTNASFPQQPLSPYLFPKAAVYSALQSVPNPYEFSVDSVKILATSGQNVNALGQYVPEEIGETEIMGLMMKFRHICPNAPDALQCIPMQGNDPFILKELPNVFVAGNMKAFKTNVTREGVRLIAVPKFANSKSFVIMNRFSLEPSLITLESLLD